ncbi:MAG: hypothetical protein DMF40_15490 [Verrucomicrobia bacterium]|nr:MAG: hypothetical protein DMF40_15490 [Verrucomicrobiota bacterium]
MQATQKRAWRGRLTSTEAAAKVHRLDWFSAGHRVGTEK